MKEKEYGLDCWQGWINYAKKELGRQLTEKDVKWLMQQYIGGKKIENVIGEKR